MGVSSECEQSGVTDWLVAGRSVVTHLAQPDRGLGQGVLGRWD